MANNRALVAVSPDDAWLFLAWKGWEVEHEVSQTSAEVLVEAFLEPLPLGLSVLDFDVVWKPEEPDHCDVVAVNVTSRRPTPEEVAALHSETHGALQALWVDVSSYREEEEAAEAVDHMAAQYGP